MILIYIIITVIRYYSFIDNIREKICLYVDLSDAKFDPSFIPAS